MDAVRPVEKQPGYILVVDDNRLNRMKLAMSLQQQGHAVALAENGLQALEMMRADSFDLVLLDILMPEMDGYQVLETMKQEPALRALPVIVISALDELESIVRCIEMGAEDYLPKPFNPVLLRARIDACLEKKRLRDQEQAYLVTLQAERDKAEHLLLNILPQPVAEKLKRGQLVIADSFADVTVLFADIVGFTRMAERMTPSTLIMMLDGIFTRFDELAAKYGLEKIKTIGDNYLIAGGLPTPREDHAEAVADMALDMQQAIQGIDPGQGRKLEIRIGMHTGPVVAGVVGRKKFVYDLWGDTMNVAESMEANGVPGRIQVSAVTQQRLHKKYLFEPRGLVSIKNKPEMMAYFLVNKKEKGLA